MKPVTDVIIVAAGSGTRLGAELPKAFVSLDNRPLFLHSTETFATHSAVRNIILVVPAIMRSQAIELTNSIASSKQIHVVEGGAERWQSVKNGVAVSSAEWIMIHDAARPFVTPKIIDSVLDMTDRFDAVISATPEVDTIRKYDGELAGETIDRSNVMRVQTPQLFRRIMLLEAFKHGLSLPSLPTDEAMLMEAAGVPVGIAWGDPLNFKITTMSDFLLAQILLSTPKS